MIPEHTEKLKRIGSVAYSRFETVCNSFNLARMAIRKSIPGAFVECGVAAGAQIGAMAYACIVEKCSRPLWLFDSFCGIPLAGPRDNCQPGIGKINHNVNVPPRELLKSTGVSKCSEKGVRDNFNLWGLPMETTVFVKGWFEDTVPITKLDKIAVLRLDGDLYSSTKVCVEHLYPKVSPGGIVIIDDYALVGARAAVDEYMGEFKYNVVPKTQTVIWWCKEKECQN